MNTEEGPESKIPDPLTGYVVGTGVDPVTYRFSGGRSPN